VTAKTAKTANLLRHLASRPGHDEVKADFRELLVAEFGVEIGALEFERRVPEVRGRLDALIGRTVFEAKSDLPREWADVARKMPDYLADREREEGEKFVGLATDGLKWAAFELSSGALEKIKETQLDPERSEEFLAWLDGVVALKSSLPPDPLTIRSELGRDSLAFRRADAELSALWERLKADPAVHLKRRLWAELLKLVYGRDVDNDELWRQHTFLVVVAKCVALAVSGLKEDDPKRLLSGDAFVAAGISGAVESDFFDWVVADTSGEALLRRIMAHVRRFRLAEVHTDILKVLYESLIDRDDRHGLGEYYTPDWLAAKIVKAAVDRPLEQKVLDPACGSGTFLFHAVRHVLAEAEDAGLEPDQHAIAASQLVQGLDIHPVAVIIARVTYLLALAPAMVARKGPVPIPVYLGDAMQLAVSSHFHEKKITILAPAGLHGEPPTALDFPETFCRDANLFDSLIEIIKRCAERDMPRAEVESWMTQAAKAHFLNRVNKLVPPRPFGREEADGIKDLGATYETYVQLRKSGRDTIWPFVARNLARPLSLSFAGGWANVVVGNPPWVAFRHMTPELQKRFKELAKAAGVFVGGKFATQNDLCALFTVRAASLYLRAGGRLALVLPMAVLSRGQYEKLRSGSYLTGAVQWDAAWAMNDDVQPLFPVPSCVLIGRRRATSRAVPEEVRVYSGLLPMRDAPEALVDRLIADGKFTVTEQAPRPTEGMFAGGSAYRSSFRQGATLVPRMLCFVERKPAGRLGVDPSAPYVLSRRSSQEKRPWKDLPGIENQVEAEYLRPVLLGESILPYRVWRPFEAVVPVDEQGAMLDSKAALKRFKIGLNDWMRKAEKVWNEYRPSEISLVQQLDYYGKLSSQFPTPKLRVVYAKAGTLPAATVVRDSKFVADHKLYWSTVATEGEARYLAAILNSETTRARAEKWQSRGQWGARDFDKVVFNLPIPRYDAKNETHAALAKLAAKAEKIAAAVALPEGVKFQRARKLVRDALLEAGIAGEIDGLVARLLDE
jgi:SAM-dependent methyltransferase